MRVKHGEKNHKVLIIVFIAFLFAFVFMIFAENYTKHQIVDDFYQNYSENILKSEAFFMSESELEHLALSEALSKQNIFNENLEYREKVIAPLIDDNFYSSVYMFNGKGKKIYSSNGLDVEDYDSLLTYIGKELAPGEVYYSYDRNEFYSMNEHYVDGTLAGIFVWEKSVEAIEKDLFSSEVGDFYMIRHDGFVMIPTELLEISDFSYDYCVNNINFGNRHASYIKMKNPERCFFFEIPHTHDEIFLDSIKRIFISTGVGFLFFLFFYVIRGYFLK